MKTAYLVDAVRTPRAKKGGKFSSVHPADLATYPLHGLIARTKIDPAAVEDVAMGCVTQTGEQGWCIARKSVLAAGWPDTVPATTINRLCGSGQQAVNFIAGGIQGGVYELAIGAGLEHMTRCPMFSDISGEESPLLTQHYPGLVPQGQACEILVERYKLTRLDIDQYAVTSQQRAAKAQSEGRFSKSIVAVPGKDDQGNTISVIHDDTIRGSTTVEKLGTLKPVFKEGGAVTAGNASSIVDGAAAILLASETALKRHNLTPRARIVSMVAVGSEPKVMLTGPISASQQALKKAGLTTSQIDLWEINEAFAPVPVVTMRELELDPAKVNVNGGGVSLGHPLGATGVMLLNTALDELERTTKRYALITMCIGLGMGIATVIERV